MTDAGIETYMSAFAAPGAAYRGKPFWAWNGMLETDELRRQIGVFQQMGFGGFFMHARIGLETPYLGPEWFDAVRTCVHEARQLGMEAWLYDEDEWPSGSASHQVTERPELRARALVMKVYEDPAAFTWTPDVVAAFAANLAGRAATDIEVLNAGQASLPPDGRSVVAMTVTTGGHPDRMNPDAVQAFLSLTHEAYAREIGDAFGSVVPGIFTDEPDYAGCGGALLPWTERLPAVFQARYGYDLLPRLIELYYNVDGREMSQARWHYHDCITHLFVDAFGRLIGEWCAAHGLSYTGHLVEEDTLMCQARSIGSAMRFYEHMQVPGIDLLMERCRIYNTAKQCSSVARQLGREQRLSEMYACMGWDASFEVYKALGDWQAACGINLRCSHLSWYTMRGEAKRDYPPSASYQSPWWQHYEKVETYFARVHAAMSRGQEVRDLLVIHPVESMWAIRTHAWRTDPQVIALGNAFDDLPLALLEAHCDFDYGDEELMSRHAAVTTADGGARLRVGQAEYRAVLVPQLKTIRGSTVRLLRHFAESGGQVVFAGAPPDFMDACPSAEPAQLARTAATVADEEGAIIDAVRASCRRITITDAAGTNVPEAVYLLKEDAEAFYLFVANTGCTIPRMKGMALRTGQWRFNDPPVSERRAAYPDVRIRGFGGCRGGCLELDAETGEVFAADATPTDGRWEIRTSLPRIGSRIFLVYKDRTEALEAPPRIAVEEKTVRELSPDRWQITLSEPNCLVLDRPRFRIGSGDRQGPKEILRVDLEVRKALGIAPRMQRGQPWKLPPVERPRRVPVELLYTFEVDTVPPGSLSLAIESPESFTIVLNDTPIDAQSASGWWVDQSLRTMSVDPGLLKPGRNTLKLTLDYTESFSGLEIVYLLGDFGVRLSGVDTAVTAPPRDLALGDWCKQGLAFYGGAVSYRHRIRPRLDPGQRVVLQLGEYCGTCVRVCVDGKPVGIAAWAPNEVDITDAVNAAPNADVELSIELFGHRRNSHGPLHLTEPRPAWTGPADFLTDARDDYALVPVGLMTPPRLATIRPASIAASPSGCRSMPYSRLAPAE